MIRLQPQPNSPRPTVLVDSLFTAFLRDSQGLWQVLGRANDLQGAVKVMQMYVDCHPKEGFVENCRRPIAPSKQPTAYLGLHSEVVVLFDTRPEGQRRFKLRADQARQLMMSTHPTIMAQMVDLRLVTPELSQSI